MRFVILCLILAGLVCMTNADAVNCDYKVYNFEIKSLNLNIPYYTCLFKKIRSSWNIFGSKNMKEVTSIVGQHESDETDDDVKYVINYKDRMLQTLTSVFCDKFKNLEAIVLYMKLESVDEEAFWNCRSLSKLELHSNNFYQLPASLLILNGRLQTITIAKNSQLSSLPQGFFESQNQLEFLALSDNNFKSLPSGIFTSLAKLKLLELGGNNLDLIDPKWLGSLKNLQYLSIERNKLTEVPEKCVKSLESVKTLWLGSNEISTLHADSFFGLDNLGALSLSGNQLTYLPYGVFAGLKNLQQLDLSSNKLTIIHSASFGSLPNLWSIRFEDNQISSIDEKMVDLTAIKWINMTNNTCYKRKIENYREAVKPALKRCFANYESRP